MARDDDDFVSRVGKIFSQGGKSKAGSTAARLAEIEAGLGGEEGGKKKKFVPGLPRRATLAHYGERETTYGAGRPRYFAGEEDLPAQLPPHNIGAIQRLMVEAGLLDSPRWGFWDEESKLAYQTALGEANRAGVDIETLLTSYAETGAAGSQEAAAPYVAEPMRIQVPNKKDVEKVFRDAVVDQLGVGWTQEEISQAADMYLWKVMQPQADAYRQMEQFRRETYDYETGAGGPPTTRQITEVDAMAPETFIEEEAKRRDPGGFQATQIAEDYAPAFFSALGGFV